MVQDNRQMELIGHRGLGSEQASCMGVKRRTCGTWPNKEDIGARDAEKCFVA